MPLRRSFGGPRRRVLILLASLLLILPTAQPTRAATGTITIGNGGADGELGSGFERTVTEGTPEAWAVSSGCSVGGFELSEEPDIGLEFRFALEFPLAALPEDATITAVALGLAGLGDALQTAIYGYAGGGSITSSDVDVSGTPVLFEPGFPDLVRRFHDVTALVTAEVLAAGWAGFSVRQEPQGPNQPYSFFCPLDQRFDDLFPVLTIEYNVPDPEPTPAPTPAVDALPNTATDPATPTGGWAVVAIGVLLGATFVWMPARRIGRKRGKPPVTAPE